MKLNQDAEYKLIIPLAQYKLVEQHPNKLMCLDEYYLNPVIWFLVTGILTGQGVWLDEEVRWFF